MMRGTSSLDRQALRSILAVAESGSFRRAATLLGITQPALSKSLKHIEGMLGVALFDRGPSGAMPNAYGKLLVDQGRLIVAAIDELERDIRFRAGLEGGSMRIGVSPTAKSLVSEAAWQYSERNPQIEISLEVGHPEQLAVRMIRGELDLIVSNDEIIDPNPNLRRKFLREDEVLFFAGRGHPLVDQPYVDAAEISRYRLIMPFLTPRAVRWLADEGFTATNGSPASIRCNCYEMIAQKMADGASLSVAPRYVIERLASAYPVAAIPVRNMHYIATLCCIQPTMIAPSDPVRKMVAALQRMMRKGAAFQGLEVPVIRSPATGYRHQ
jgi:DNA-binding transcriptional LysR family regulator